MQAEDRFATNGNTARVKGDACFGTPSRRPGQVSSEAPEVPARILFEGSLAFGVVGDAPVGARVGAQQDVSFAGGKTALCERRGMAAPGAFCLGEEEGSRAEMLQESRRNVVEIWTR